MKKKLFRVQIILATLGLYWIFQKVYNNTPYVLSELWVWVVWLTLFVTALAIGRALQKPEACIAGVVSRVFTLEVGAEGHTQEQQHVELEGYLSPFCLEEPLPPEIKQGDPVALIVKPTHCLDDRRIPEAICFGSKAIHYKTKSDKKTLGNLWHLRFSPGGADEEKNDTKEDEKEVGSSGVRPKKR